jgi:hypothetical protein
LSRFLRICTQSLEKVQKRVANFFVKKLNMDIKNVEFHADLVSVENVLKMHQNKVTSKNVPEICTFSLFSCSSNLFLRHVFELFQQI